jgi:hypothetical protein
LAHELTNNAPNAFLYKGPSVTANNPTSTETGGSDMGAGVALAAQQGAQAVGNVWGSKVQAKSARESSQVQERMAKAAARARVLAAKTSQDFLTEQGRVLRGDTEVASLRNYEQWLADMQNTRGAQNAALTRDYNIAGDLGFNRRNEYISQGQTAVDLTNTQSANEYARYVEEQKLAGTLRDMIGAPPGQIAGHREGKFIAPDPFRERPLELPSELQIPGHVPQFNRNA